MLLELCLDSKDCAQGECLFVVICIHTFTFYSSSRSDRGDTHWSVSIPPSAIYWITAIDKVGAFPGLLSRAAASDSGWRPFHAYILSFLPSFFLQDSKAHFCFPPPLPNRYLLGICTWVTGTATSGKANLCYPTCGIPDRKISPHKKVCLNIHPLQSKTPVNLLRRSVSR